MSTKPSHLVPDSERRISSKWEEVTFLFAKYTGYGLAAGALTSIVLLRRGTHAPARVAMSFYGAGVGSGIAYSLSNAVIERELKKCEEEARPSDW